MGTSFTHPRKINVTTELIDTSLRKVFLGALRTGIHIDATDDVMAVLKVLRAARPLEPLLAMTEAMQLIKQGHRNAARMTLEEADANIPGNAIVKAALAWVLAGQGDGLWQAYADEVRALPPEDIALRMIASIEKSVHNESDEPEADGTSAAPAGLPDGALAPYMLMGVAC
jgi:predicted Zn-dependent protease